MPTNDVLYEGLPDDVVFTNDEGFTLRTRKVSGEPKPTWVKKIGPNENKRKPSTDDLAAFEDWKENLLRPTQEEAPEVEAEWEPPFSTNDDGKVLEIWGKLVEVNHTRHEPPVEIGQSPYVTLEVTVEDTVGEMHEFDVSKGGVANLLAAHDPSRWSYSAREFHDADREERDEFLKPIVDQQRPLLWRVIKKDELPDDAPRGRLLTVRTKDWVKTTANDILPYVKKALNDNDITFDKVQKKDSDGVHGGSVRVIFGDQNLFQPQIYVEAGKLGGQSMKVYGSMKILACSNMLSADVRREILGLMEHQSLATKVFSRKVHRGDMQGVMESVVQVAGAVSRFNEFIDTAKEARLSEPQAKKILEYYQKKGIISKKVSDFIETYIGNEDIEQVVGTYYGLAMILSYIGTHQGFKDGVSRRLSILACEILLVSNHPRKFSDLVNETLEVETETATAQVA